MKINKYLKEFKNDKKKISILTLSLLALLWLNHMLTDAINFNRIKKSETKTNHFLNNFVIEQTGDDGNVKWTLNGDRLEKFPYSERSEVINPHMIVNSTNDEKWNVTAKHALDPNSKFESIYLTDNVKFQKWALAHFFLSKTKIC